MKRIVKNIISEKDYEFLRNYLPYKDKFATPFNTPFRTYSFNIKNKPDEKLIMSVIFSLEKYNEK